MIRRGTASIGEKAVFYRRAGVCALTVGLGLTWLSSAAEAARIPVGPGRRPVADHNDDGNGHHNATAMSVRSPIRNRGYQHTTNRNAGGVSDAQNGLCHNVRVCNLTQKVTIMNPERPAPPAEAAAPQTAPARPQTAPSQIAPSPARPQTAPSQVASSPAGSFLYMGPYGLMLAGGGSSGPATSGEAGRPAAPGGTAWWLDCAAGFFS
ncbi:hypothetical protein AB0L00_08095 [Actinoallomurus sp. NPDC052308]|uniref:hypothetical protein n=1 Tax=Actinoallomurus sp. NPDC052308 TaxID=3155530 RepID=UPI0034231AA1